MVVVQYFIGTIRVGMLLWMEEEGRLEARGGYDSPEASRATCTLVTTPKGERVLAGSVHPDQIAEVSGQDGIGVKEVKQ